METPHIHYRPLARSDKTLFNDILVDYCTCGLQPNRTCCIEAFDLAIRNAFSDPDLRALRVLISPLLYLVHVDHEKMSEPWAYHEARESMMSLGVLVCLTYKEWTTTSDKYVAWESRAWSHRHAGDQMYDLLDVHLDEETFKARFKKRYHPARPYAFLDPTMGWVDPGRMGWFGASVASSESKDVYTNRFIAWLYTGDQEDWIVVVDAHI